MMRKNNVLFFTICLLVGVLSIVAFDGCRDKDLLSQLRKENATKDSLYSALTNDVVFWKDVYGQEHARAERLQLTADEFAALNEIQARLLSIKPKQIDGNTKVGTFISVKDSLSSKADSSITLQDTCIKGQLTIPTSYTFEWNKPHLKIKGRVGSNSDSIFVSGNDTLTIVDYWKRKWFLGKAKQYTDVSNVNPYIKIGSITRIEKKRPIYRWSLGPSIQYGITPKGAAIWSAGLSLQYSLIKF